MDLQICCHFTTQNSLTDIKTNGETNTFPICLFVLSEQLVLSLSDQFSVFHRTDIHFDYNNRPSSAVSFMPAIASTSGRLHSEFVRILFLQAHRETDRFFADSGVHLAQTHPGGQFTFRRAAFLTQLQSKVGLVLSKTTVLRVNINIDGAPIASKSHSESRVNLLVYSLSLHRHSSIGFILAFASSIHNKQQQHSHTYIHWNFRSSVNVIKLGVIVLSFSPRGVLFDAEVKIRKYSFQGICFTY